jgi:Putative auto-transporter adhesin, head GIN domain
MKRIIAITACAFALQGAALAASHTYDTGAFAGVSVAGGVEADITLGTTRSVVAETRAENFDDLRISVEGNVLRIDRPSRSWFSSWFSGSRPSYQVHIVTPALHSLDVSSGSEVTVEGSLEGDFSVTSSSGSNVEVALVKGGNVKADTSSGSQISLAGSCISLKAQASSGSDLDADDLSCENVTVQASSGSDVSVTATKSVKGDASSGSDIRVRGKPAVVQVEKSSGADVKVKE